jgi:hypothetical protein
MKQLIQHLNHQHSNVFNHFSEQLQVCISIQCKKISRISFENFLALTNSTKVNRVVQVKTTVVAFGSSTPTNRLPSSIVKTTPGPTPSASITQKISTPKSKYNLRTRLFNNHPISKDQDEGVKEKFY